MDATETARVWRGRPDRSVGGIALLTGGCWFFLGRDGVTLAAVAACVSGTFVLMVGVVSAVTLRVRTVGDDVVVTHFFRTKFFPPGSLVVFEDSRLASRVKLLAPDGTRAVFALDYLSRSDRYEVRVALGGDRAGVGSGRGVRATRSFRAQHTSAERLRGRRGRGV